MIQSKSLNALGVLLIAILLMISCQKENDTISPASKEKGYLQLALKSNPNNAGGRLAAVNTDTWNVIIRDIAGDEILNFPDYTDVPEAIALPVGRYTAFVSSEDNSVAFENAFYTGTSDIFNIVENDSTEVTVTVTLTNVKVSVIYSDRVRSDFDDFNTTVSSSRGSLVYDTAETRSGNFPAGYDLTVKADLVFTKPDLTTEVRSISTIIFDTEPRDHYRINIDYDLIDYTPEDGAINPLIIIIDSTTNDIDIGANGGTFARNFGGTQDDRATSVQQTADGGYIMAGYTNSADVDVSDPKGGYDYWLVKLDARGVEEWQTSLGGSGDDYAKSVQQTADGGYIVAGYTNSTDGDITDPIGNNDYWIVKLDGSGVQEWQTSLGGSGDDQAQSVQPTDDGGYIVTGYTNSTNGHVTGGTGNYGYWTVKLDAPGNLVWQKFITSYNLYAQSVQQTSDGNIVVTGYYDYTRDVASYTYKLDGSNGAIIWSTSYNASSRTYAIDQTTDGGYIAAGYHSTSGNNFMVYKMNASGTVVWGKYYGGTSDDRAYSIQQTLDGGYIVAGYSASTNGDITTPRGGSDYWLTKLDASGNLQWQKSLGGASGDYAASVRQTADGGYVVAGYSESTATTGDVVNPKGGNDYWIVKLDANGNL